MRRALRSVAALAFVLVAAVAVGACAPQTPTAVEPAKQALDQQTQQEQASVDATLNAVQDKVTELAKTVGDLEARINGLQVNSDLQEIQRQLTAAIGEAGDKKKAALDQLSASFNNLISKVDAAAAQLPAGGPVQTELAGFSQKLKDIQADLATAAASAEASSTP
jgi:chromosome segregation ATPase